MKTINRWITCLFSFIFIVPVAGLEYNIFGQATNPGNKNVIYINQVGYQPLSSKIALVNGNTHKFSVIDANSKAVVLTGDISAPEYWPFSGDSLSTADFSALKTPGLYQLCIGQDNCSYPFEIKGNVYHELAKAAIKAFYFNRASFPLTAKYSGKWARPAGHPDTKVLVHASAASKARPEGTIISSPGGWYDAGDYNKYIVNSGITTYTLLLFYQLYPDYCQSLKTNIPESSNNIPDVVDELLYNLKWMLTMQDPNDGGVYHKLTNKSFDPFVMPDKAVAPRYVVEKSTAATLDFAAVMAMASRVFSNSKIASLKTLSKTCLLAATKAMKWANLNPAKYYIQPSDISTGTYGDEVLDDEFFWAKSEMCLATGNKSWLNEKDILNGKAEAPSWGNVSTLGLMSLALSNDHKFNDYKIIAQKQLISRASILADKANASACKVSLDIFKWGSNSDVANQAIVEWMAYKFTADKKYLTAFQENVDYLLGKNPTGYCFVTGFGTQSPKNIHHRISAADGVKEPVPGFLVGGPNTVVMKDCGDKVQRSTFPAKSYADEQCSYSTNEIAINWNAPLFFVIG
ncbi:MAG: glycoside hydrolase family 9 protein, partial [Bacteroidota bacterium]|nr:glycoside hydrolase family 9 protein [Bacteroidota bacterium]